MRAATDLGRLRIADAPRGRESVRFTENDNDSQYLSQHVRPETRSAGSERPGTVQKVGVETRMKTILM
jgi:hypothetical protein